VRAVLTAIQDGHATSEDISEHLGIRLRTMQNYLVILRDLGLIVYTGTLKVGRGRTNVYILP